MRSRAATRAGSRCDRPENAITTENLAATENATKDQRAAMAEWSEDMPRHAVLDPQDDIEMRRAE